jgi:hypothetical protein
VDAAFFHLYGLNRDDTAYVLGTFTVLKNGEERRLGRYETAERILAAYDAMAAAIASGQPFTTRLDPPPADPSLTHDSANARPAMPARLVRATISNYRSLSGPWKDSARQASEPLAPNVVSLGSITVLVGQDSAGKSSFCDALAFVADALRLGLESALTAKQNRGGFESLRREGGDTLRIRIDAEQGDLTGFYELELEAAPGGGCRVKREAASWRSKFEFREQSELKMFALREKPEYRELGDLLVGVESYNLAPDNLRTLGTESSSGFMNGAGRDWPVSLERVLAGPNRVRFIDAMNRLTKDIVDVQVQRIGTTRVVQFKHLAKGDSGAGRWVDAHEENDGTLCAAGLFTALLQDPLPPVIAIEEPELAEAPGAMELLFEFIHAAHRQAQVIITTRSPELMNQFEPDLVRVVTRHGDITRITAVDADPIQARNRAEECQGSREDSECLPFRSPELRGPDCHG